MSQNEYTVNLFFYEDGTLAAHSGDIRGLVIETDDFADMREELLRVAPRLLRSNHGLTDAEIEQTSIRLVFRDVEDQAVQPEPKPRRPCAPRLLWEDDPRLTACA